jgi:hypothetical protein
VFGAKQNWRIEMSASRILGLMVVSAWLAVGCSGAKKIDVGGACILNSDCNSPLVCTMGKCHDACHTSADCPTGQSCVKTGNSTICQLPAEGDCSKTASCGVGFVCASDQRCRTACQSSTDCTSEQTCMSGICHDACQVSADCPTGQSCVKTNNTTLCQLPAEADCSKTLSCSGAFVCAPDQICRTACQSRTDCTTEQMCVGGVCAAPADLDPNGQLPQKGPSLRADGGVNAPDAGGQGADVTVAPAAPADAGSLDSGADLPVGPADARVQEASASDLANRATDAPQFTQPDSGPGTGSDAKTADSGGGLPVPDAGAADRSPTTLDSSGDMRGDSASDAAGVSCGTSVCSGGGCCVADTCVPSGATCSTGGTCAAGSCASPASLSVSPSSLDFGSVTTGQSSSPLSFTILNAGQQTSGAITVTSDNADFAVQTGGALDCVSGKTTLAPNTACTVRLMFSPKLGGARTGTVTFSATPGGSAGVSVSGTGVCPVDQPNDGTGRCVPMAGVVWTQRGTQQYWRSVASSSDGAKLVAVSMGKDGNGGDIYTSVDFGATWTPHGFSQAWESVASSSDGAKLVAVFGSMNAGYVYTSVDSGATWTPHGAISYWKSVASSSDGTKLVAVTRLGYIYTSVDSGATWMQTGTKQDWSSVASSSDGAKLVAVVVNGGYIYTSLDSGATWMQTGAQQNWISVASSSDGTKLVAGISGGDIYTSGDSGATWTPHGMRGTWYSVASSGDGTKLVSGAGYIYTSVDSGATWTSHGAASAVWRSVTSSSNGTKLVAVNEGGYIYTSTGPVP